MFAHEQPPRPFNAHSDSLRAATPRLAPTLRSPGGATTQTEKSTPVHTSNPSCVGSRSSPCGVPYSPCHTGWAIVSTKAMLYWHRASVTAPCSNTTGDVSHQSAGMYPFQNDALAFLTLGAVLYRWRDCIPACLSFSAPETILYVMQLNSSKDNGKH